MNKKTFFLLIILFLFTGIVHAEKCTIVSGTGANIGDEIACGTEHFYVINNNGKKVKMLAKYNLYAGTIFERSENKQITSTQGESYSMMQEICANEGYDEFYQLSYTKQSNNTYVYDFYCRTYTYIDDDEIKQSEEAIGAHGDKSGKPVFPEVGIFQIDPYNMKKYPKSPEPFYNFEFIDPDWSNYYSVADALEEYEDYLLDNDYNISKVSVITVDELNELVYAITNKELPLDEWTNRNIEPEVNEFNQHVYRIGSIKEELPEGYEWVYSTTYWTRTMNVTDVDSDWANGYYYFVDTLGDLCATDSCPAAVGAGVRPVVTMDIENIDYNIKTKTDGNGSIKVEKVTATGGEVIKFTLEPKEGYVLGSVKVTDENGNVIEFTKDELQGNTFTMPNANVLIEATFVVKNAKTADIAITTIILLCILSIIVIFIQRKKIEKE